MMKNLADVSNKNNQDKPKVIAVVGPTASGKTVYSIELAKKINGEIISADSRLVYKGFNIACAKPTIEEQCGIPHYMIDIIEPEYDYSAALYAREAKKCIYEIIKKGKTPIITGGTGLYFRLLLENYELPKAKPNPLLRESLTKLGNKELHKILSELDSEAGETININDRKKLIRAIEIIKETNKPLKASRSINDNQEFDIEWIGKNLKREELYEKINNRVDKMYEDGIVNETKFLIKKHGRIPNIVDTIGYHEIVMYLDGLLSLDEALNMLKQNTRRYAKRQLTWFRKNTFIKWDIYPDKLKK